VPACIGVKLGRPENLVVGVVGDYSFQFLMEEVAVAVQYRVPYVLIMLNNAYMGLIRQAELGYDMNFAVDLGYEGPDSEYGIDNVKVMEAMGALGRRVTNPEELQEAFDWAVKTSEERRVPVLVEVMCERETNAAMGLSIDKINEYEPILDGATETAGQVVGGIPERD
jgi:tartronate-semialdehyde synthase